LKINVEQRSSKIMQLTRRNVLGLSVGAAAFTLVGGRIAGLRTLQLMRLKRAIMDFTGGAAPAKGRSR
jgi:sulfur-oxidizing protein SoxY